MDRDETDPTGVIAESYRIDGIDAAQCRSIFLDWALSLREPATAASAIPILMDRHGSAADHPMTHTLRAGLEAAAPARRRGGRAGRFDDAGN